MELAAIVYLGSFLIDDTGCSFVAVAQDVEQPLVEVAQAVGHAHTVLPVQPPGDGPGIQKHLAAVTDVQIRALAHEHAGRGGAAGLGGGMVVLDDDCRVEVAMQTQCQCVMHQYLLLATVKQFCS